MRRLARTRNMRRRSRPAPKQPAGKWLEAAMREAPTRGAKSKREWRKEAKEKFNVSGRAFDQIWATALQSTGANWDRRGRAAQAAEIIKSPHEN